VSIAARPGTKRILCSVDNGRTRACGRRPKFVLSPGWHSIAVRAVYKRATSKAAVVRVVVPDPAPEAVQVGGEPVGIDALGSRVWVSGGTSGDVSLIDADSRTVTSVTHVGGNLGGLGASPDGVWVSDFGGGAVVRISPVTGAVMARVPVGGQPTGIDASQVGAVWVGNLDGYVSRIDPAPNQVVAKIDLPSGASMPFYWGAFVWVGLQNGSVTVIDPFVNRVVFAPIVVAPDVDALAISHEAQLWVSTFAGSVALIDPPTNKVLFKRRLPGRGSGITVAGEIAWASDYDHAWVVKLDSAKGTLLGAVKTGSRPRESVEAGGYVWVLDQADGAVTPIPLPAASLR
jgi:streptogramin lyase